MWLQNLLFLVTVARSISAPTGNSVTWPSKLKYAIREALHLLKDSEDTLTITDTVKIVSGKFNPKKPTCLRTHLGLFKQGLRGKFTSLEGPLTVIDQQYKEHCPPTLETACTSQTVTFKTFKKKLETFLHSIPFDCWSRREAVWSTTLPSPARGRLWDLTTRTTALPPRNSAS
ncbi:PREDICTED: granulocyte-macrophage colony-stimulating factor-like [Elephantulus edwardii]|uniref:granulocyte-macrophage colony-stimulating factor-like n=1 Tax=Elephantulus edwardii TaxID=28737 RepID=UPI0003F0DD3B|nr:PREDICTED: granulocyte-macrophage colony-stimulating factor-like [Elephantulus edwardii]